MSIKNSKDTIGNRIRYLPVCSAEPQPTAPDIYLMYLYMTFRKLPFIATSNSFHDYNIDNSVSCVSEILTTFCVKA